jgi:hypothetical protein
LREQPNSNEMRMKSERIAMCFMVS